MEIDKKLVKLLKKYYNDATYPELEEAVREFIEICEGKLKPSESFYFRGKYV